MKWDDVSVDGVWSVKNGVKREKGTGGELVLPYHGARYHPRSTTLLSRPKWRVVL